MKRIYRHIKNNAIIYTAHSLSLFIAALFYYKLIGWFPLREAAMKVRLKTVFWSLQIAIYILLLVTCQLILPFLL